MLFFIGLVLGALAGALFTARAHRAQLRELIAETRRTIETLKGGAR